MDEELNDIIIDETIEVENPETDIEVKGVDTEVPVEETIDIVAIETVEEIEIDMSEAIGWSGGDGTRHSDLIGTDNYNQHPIKSITGLRAELDEIKKLKTVESDKLNIANYYKWHTGAYDTYGYFVSIFPETSEIEICKGSNIFGVSINFAGFVGGQVQDAPRDNSYGLIATSGLVDVRCELDVDVGDYVICNTSGYAKKAESDYGYKVFAIEDKDGVRCALISLDVQADVTNAIGADLIQVHNTLETHDSNIISAINVANQAYSKAEAASNSASSSQKDVEEVLREILGFGEELDEMEKTLVSSSIISAQAKAIAESAATSAATLRNEAVEKANEALKDTVELRKEFEALSGGMSGEASGSVTKLQESYNQLKETTDKMQETIDQASKDLEDLEDDLIPLATWPNAENPIGIAGFVAKANEDSATLASMVTWKGDAGESLAGFVQKATEENATVSAIASYKRKDANGNVIEPGGAAGLVAQVDANQAVVQTVAALDGGIAGLEAKVKDNMSSVSLLASQTIGDYVPVDVWDAANKDINKIYYAADTKDYWYYKNNKWNSTKNTHEAGLSGAIAGVQSVADESKAQLDAMVAYDKDGKSALAGLTTYVDANSAQISQLANYQQKDDKGNVLSSGTAGLIAQVEANKSSIDMLAQLDGDGFSGLAGLTAQVNDNTSNLALVSKRVTGKYTVLDTWSSSGKDTSTIYYVKPSSGQTSGTYYYYNDGWKSTTDAGTAGLPTAIGGIQVVSDDHSSQINSLVSWQGTTNTSMARIEQKADVNGAYIQSTVANIDKYSVGPYSQSYNFKLDQAKSILESGIIYVPTVSHTETLPTERTFTQQYYYTWDGEKWVTSSSVAVALSNTYVTGTTNKPYWYIPGNNNITKDDVIYKAHTLYKWESYVGKDNKTYYHWVAVATLEGNSQNRAVSQIRQDTNSVVAEVTNARGSAASLSAKLTATDSLVNTVASWKDSVSGDVAKIATIEQKANANGASIGLVVKDGKASGSLIIGAINGESTAKISADRLDIEGKTLNIKVASTNITGALTIGQLPATVAETSDIPTNVSQLTNDSGYQNATGVVSIAQGAITADFVKTLGLEVGNEIKMGANATISWDNVSNKDSVASKTDVSDAKTAAINTASTDATNKANAAQANAVNTIEGKGYQNAADVTTISRNEISTATINANQINTTNLSAISADMGTVTAGILMSEGADWTDEDQNKLEATGLTIDLNKTSPYIYGPGFRLDKNGIRMVGSITAKSGRIGPWEIDETNQCIYADIITASGDRRQKHTFELGSNGLYARCTYPLGYLDYSIMTASLDYNQLNFFAKKNDDSVINASLDFWPTSDYVFRINCLKGLKLGHDVLVEHDLTVKNNLRVETNYDFNVLFGNDEFAVFYSDDNNFASICPDSGNFQIKTENGRAFHLYGAGSTNRLQGGSWWLGSSSAITSDRNLKHSIVDMPEKYSVFFDNLRSVAYKYNDGNSNRYHIGYIAQEVDEALQKAELTRQDFAGVCITDEGTEKEEWALRYAEFVPLNTYEIQKLKARVAELEAQLASLK